MKLKLLLLFLGICFATFSVFAAGQAMERKSPLLAYAKDRVIRPIDDAQRVVLAGNRHPLAQPQFRLKPVPSDFPMDRMMLVLSPDIEQQAALDDLVAQQHDVTSPYYHQWITPERFGQLFGTSEGDIALVVNWLTAHGMNV